MDTGVPRNCKILHLPRPSKSKQHLFFYKKKKRNQKPEGKGSSLEKARNHWQFCAFESYLAWQRACWPRNIVEPRRYFWPGYGRVYTPLGVWGLGLVRYEVRIKHIELPAKLLDYFLRSNKSNINQSCGSFPAGWMQSLGANVWMQGRLGLDRNQWLKGLMSSHAGPDLWLFLTKHERKPCHKIFQIQECLGSCFQGQKIVFQKISTKKQDFVGLRCALQGSHFQGLRLSHLPRARCVSSAPPYSNPALTQGINWQFLINKSCSVCHCKLLIHSQYVDTHTQAHICD